MKTNRKLNLLTLGTVLLIVVISLAVISAAFFGGIIPGFEFGGVYTHSPTATYSGYFSISYVGVYHYVRATPVCRAEFPPCIASDEALFYMNAKNGTIRLIFYCGSAAKYFCENPSQLQFTDGTCLRVKGTLLKPSKWPSQQFSPAMNFDGDLYVFENETLPQIACT